MFFSEPWELVKVCEQHAEMTTCCSTSEQLIWQAVGEWGLCFDQIEAGNRSPWDCYCKSPGEALTASGYHVNSSIWIILCYSGAGASKRSILQTKKCIYHQWSYISSCKPRNTNWNPGLLESKDHKRIELHSTSILDLPGKIRKGSPPSSVMGLRIQSRRQDLTLIRLGVALLLTCEKETSCFSKHLWMGLTVLLPHPASLISLLPWLKPKLSHCRAH